MQADFGVAFDGDGDRIAVVDNLGEVIWPDYILGLLYADMGQPKTVYDLRISHSIKEYITNGMESPVGYVNIKKRMQESGADLGGELSGHFFFQDLRYAESPMLVLLKLLMMVNKSKKPISKLVDPFRKYAHSGEIRIEINEKEQAANIVEKLKQKYSDGNISEMDGITIEYPDWWFNLRASNTEPILKLVVEAETQELLERRQAKLLELIRSDFLV